MTDFVIVLSVVFVSAGAFLLLANHLELPPVPFYIIAGLTTGTFLAEPELVELALWGVAFLVFVFGTRVDLNEIRSVLRDGESAAMIQLIVVAPIGFAVGYAIGGYFGLDYQFRNALYFSAAATLSSTLVGRRALEEEIRNNLVHGRLASSVHFFDDVIAIGAILVFSAEVLTDTTLITSKIGWGVLFVIAGLLTYQYGFPLLLRLAEGGDELVLMGSISILIAFLAAAETVGISVVVGAFAAGLSIRSEGAESLAVRNGIQSIRDFFAAIFFVTIGALVTLPGVEVLVLTGVLIMLVVVLNPLIHTVAFLIEGYDGRTGFLAGSSLNQISELSLVIVLQAWILGTIAPALFEAIILAAAITMILGSLTGRYEYAIYDNLLAQFVEGFHEYTRRHSQVAIDITDHVVIVGYGRQGRRIVSQLEDLGVNYVVIENDPYVQDDLVGECANYVFGDAMADHTMELARLTAARCVISTVDHRPVSESILSQATESVVILREDSSVMAQELLDAGATFVAVPSVLAADQLIENVERILGDEGEIDALREEHYEYLQQIQVAGLERRYSDTS